MQHALVVQAARFGDLVQTKRLIFSLKREGQVSLLVDRSLAPLARLLYEDVCVYEAVFHGKLDGEGIRQNALLFEALSKVGFDRIYNCNLSPLTCAVCRLFDQERVIGYRAKLGFSGAKGLSGLERSPLLARMARMTVERKLSCCNLVDLWAHFVANPIRADMVNPCARSGDRGLGVVLSGRNRRRSLPLDVLAEIVTLYARLGQAGSIYLFGTGEEKGLAKQLQRNFPRNLQGLVCDLTGKTGWKDLFEALLGLRFVITPDTGTMHLAAHLGVPVRAFFLSSALCHETGPYGTGHLVWQVERSCAPCLESAVCQEHTACLEPLRDKDFLRAVALLEQGRADTCPRGLACFQGRFDGFGLVMEPCLGLDPYAQLRSIQRKLLIWYVQHDYQCDYPPSQEEMNLLERVFAQDSDFMLPRERYL